MVRMKYRYFTVEVVFPHVVRAPSALATLLERAIRNKVKELHGAFGLASIDPGLRVKYVNVATRTLSVRVNHGPHRFVASSLPFIKKMGNVPATLHLIYTGATLRQCFLFVQKNNKRKLKKMWSTLTDEEKVKLEKAFHVTLYRGME